MPSTVRQLIHRAAYKCVMQHMTLWICLLLIYYGTYAEVRGQNEYQRKLEEVPILKNLAPNEIAIMQFDSRKPSDYWLASALWNQRYCEKHGHVFIYYASKKGCHYSSENLASPWCKVKSMINANTEYPNVKFFIYMDSDAVIDISFSDKPLNELIGIMQRKLSWNPEEKPIVFNQDGSCWWCSLVQKVGYPVCLNAGTVAWYRHEISEMILNRWWDASMDPYEGNPIKRRFRLKWPWEQDRQMSVYNSSSQYIQVASQPERFHMRSRAGISDWCLSHLPGAGCFISHFCEGGWSKKRMKSTYTDHVVAGHSERSPREVVVSGEDMETTAAIRNVERSTRNETHTTWKIRFRPSVDGTSRVEYLPIRVLKFED